VVGDNVDDLVLNRDGNGLAAGLLENVLRKSLAEAKVWGGFELYLAGHNERHCGIVSTSFGTRGAQHGEAFGVTQRAFQFPRTARIQAPCLAVPGRVGVGQPPSALSRSGFEFEDKDRSLVRPPQA
jgi:hypothetical protein